MVFQEVIVVKAFLTPSEEEKNSFKRRQQKYGFLGGHLVQGLENLFLLLLMGFSYLALILV